MGLRDDLLRVPLEQRFVYDPQQNVLFVNLSHFTVKTLEDVEQIRTTVAQRLSPLDRKVYAIVNYDGFRIDPDLIDPYFDRVKMVWGERRGHATFGAVEQSDGVPHAAIERSEPVPCRLRPG
jgi:propionate CoA-transferase